MKKIILLLLFSLSVLFNPTILQASADTYSSNCIINKIGSPPGSQPDCSQGSGTVNNNSTTGVKMVDAALVLKAAFDACDNGYAGNSCNNNQSFINAIKQSSFAANADAFFSIFPSSKSSDCVECLGFIRDVAALALGHDATDFLGQGSPSIILSGNQDSYADFVKDPSPQPGDVALTVAAGEADSSSGHIVLVQTVTKNTFGQPNGQFTAIESNYTPCTITNESSGIVHASSLFTYYRLK